MQFEYQGMCLWYGAPDAPAPSETVPTGTEISITIAVQPADASNRVEVLYRKNRGPTETAPARWVRNDPSGKTQYYRAGLPALEAGDTVEYTPICRCAGRQVPSPEQTQEFASSFRAVGAEVQPTRANAPTTARDFDERHGLESAGAGSERAAEPISAAPNTPALELPGRDLSARARMREPKGQLGGGPYDAFGVRERGAGINLQGRLLMDMEPRAMKRITPPITRGERNQKVASLQDALLLLIDREVIEFNADPAIVEKLSDERQEKVYRDATIEVVMAFQRQHAVNVTGERGDVDEPTAEALNGFLMELGAFRPAASDQQRLVGGQVRREDDQPVAGALVRAFHVMDEQDMLSLGEDNTDAEGRYTIRYELLPELSRVDLRVEAYDEDSTRLRSSEIIHEAGPLEILNLVVPVTIRPSEQRRLEGRVVFESGLPAENLKLRLYRLDFGGVKTRLNETTTRELGLYVLPFDFGGEAAGIEVRAVDAEGNEKMPSLSKPMYDLGDEARIIVNLVAPAALQSLTAEYQRLAADLAPHLGKMELAEAHENAERQDLTVLSRATGWDARLIALAANAEKLSADPDVQLPQEAVYGLLRAGLPSDKLQLAQMEPEVVEQTLAKVRDAGIVSLSDPQVADVKTQFGTFADQVRLTVPVPGSRSTYGDLLMHAGSVELQYPLDEDARKKFASIYLNHRGDADQLWNNAQDAGLNDGQIQRLQLQGKLAFLAGNSEAMTARLMRKQMTDPAQLAEQDFYMAEQWEAEVKTVAGVSPDVPIEQLSEDAKKKLQALIPPSYAGETLGDGLKAYTEDMARKVRLSYPTQVIGRMVEQDDADEFKLGEARSVTATLLKNAAAEGFRLGQTPVETFVEANPGVLNGLGDIETAKQNVKTLQRVYQITPSDEAMPVMMKLGLTSAYDVVELPQEEFVERYGHTFRSVEAARLTYRKAQQVSSVTYNLFTIAKKVHSEPQVYGMSAPDEVRESVRNELIKQFPTMESLFGSMDFCECEHCRSVLSPAAYLVDLLQFFDAEPEVWDNFLADWKKAHNGQDYTAKYKKPYDALVERRPDIPHIPLTCENTQTALPYIDVVNEILEYYVANEKLTEDAAHDTGEATTAELLAEPQNVIAGAYDKLRQARYPLGLPFDLWLETGRSFCDYFETPLWQLLETFRPGGELFEPTQPYDRATIFIESLGLSPEEAAPRLEPAAKHAIFTDPDPLKDDKWYELYGSTTAKPVIGNPTNSENATLTVPDADAAKFQVDDPCTYFDVGANALNRETMTIRAIGAAGTGGPGQTTIEFVGVWRKLRPDGGKAPKAGDLLVFDAPAALKSAKALSRRLGVTYKEIVEIVQTGFVNPELAKLVILYKLGVTIRDVMFYAEHKAFYEANKDLLGKRRDQLPPEKQLRFDALKKEDEEQSNEVLPFEKRLHEVAEFEKRLDGLTAKYPSSGLDSKIWLNKELQNDAFDGVLVLADPDAGCNFDLTTLRYTNGDAADAIAFLKINLFVRLWRKLGWTIEETDRALQAFVPENTPFEIAKLDKQPLRTALIYLAHLKALEERVDAGAQGRLKLLTLWSNLSTTGEKPLYAQLFLTRGVLKSDAVFDDPLGKYLQYFDAANKEYKPFHWDPNQPEDPKVGNVSLKSHLVALQGALGLTADEIGRILKDAGKDLATEGLSLDTVSLLYRYGLLAKALSLSIYELIALKHLSGLHPFKPLHSGPLEDTPAGVTPQKKALDFDYPFTQTLRFVEVAEQVKESGLKVEDLEYLLRHRFDETGRYAPDNDATLALLKTLAEGIRAIRAEHAVPADPGAMGEDTLRQKLGLALPPDVVERFLAMMNGTVEFTATKTGVLSENKLDPETFKDEPFIRQPSYNATRNKEQKLTFRGVLFDDQKTQLETGFAPELTTAQRDAFTDLLGGIKAEAEEFFEKYVQAFFDNYTRLFSKELGRPKDIEKRAYLLWAFGPRLVAPEILTKEVLEEKLSSVLPPKVAETFLKMWSGEIEYVAMQPQIEPGDKLDPSSFTEPEITVSYNEELKEQTLTYRGVLLAAQSRALKAKHDSPLVTALLDDVLNQVSAFYEANLRGFFTSDEFELLFNPIGDDLSDEEKKNRRREKRAKLAQAFLLFIIAADPAILTDEVLEEKLSSVLLPKVAETFLKMWSGEIEYVAMQPQIEPGDKLDPSSFTEPEITVSYNEELKEQTLTYRGVLLAAQSRALKAKHDSPLVTALLDDVLNQAHNFYKANLRGFFADSAFNLLFRAVPNGLNATLKQTLIRQKRTRTAQAFMLFVQQRLTRQFIVQTMTAQLGADPALVEALLTDTRLLGDPQPLLEAFTATGERGVNAAFFDSDDGSGVNQATAPSVASVDTALKDTKDEDGNLLNPANSARFQGYLEVPTPGAYRFYVAFEEEGAEAELRFDHLDHLSDPFLKGKAAKDGAEIGDSPDDKYVELKPGVPYRFTFNATKLNGGDVRLLVQGETMPKDSLAQLTLYPQTAIERADDAQLLLRKVLQLIESINLTEREVRYLLTHATDFGNLDLSKLPTHVADDTLDGSKALFEQFLRLAGYARLKRDLAGGKDDLIGIFETTSIDQVYVLIAKLARREETTVKATAKALFSEPSFKNELALQRLWEALQVVERFGVPVASMVGWTRIVSMPATSDQRFAIVRDLKEAIKARFEPETWQRVAQPIFDKLRKRQRDALVAHVMHQHGFARMEQLYEYFLIDPGMEPVVQTSRIRLAISSVQLFIQRCLINLEKDVPPSVINAKQWEWMKRYRVWEANRKIFLFPENWLEPEFRDDKTHLFRELEGNLLQGDVSNDLAEDAFLNYLKKLEELARLDIVAMHLEDKADPALNTLHVIGRTYSEPHKYFYRRYAHQMWTPWEPVAAEIEGDHLAPVVWRDRLYLFWVTFFEKPEQNNSAQVVNPTQSRTVPAVKKDVEAHLHWSEYLQGEWSTRESSGVSTPSPVVKPGLSSFNSKEVFIHVYKEANENDEERGVYILLDEPIWNGFYLAGRNSIPEPAGYTGGANAELAIPYSANSKQVTRYSATNGPLTVKFSRRLTTQGSTLSEVATETQSILDHGNSYTLLPCNNGIQSDPEIASLMNPVIYQDNEHTLFIEPNVEESTIEEWKTWVTPSPDPGPGSGHQPWPPSQPVDPHDPHSHLMFVKAMSPKPELPTPIDPDDPIWRLPIDRNSRSNVEPGEDWLVNPATVLLFEGELIGPGGKAGMAVLPATELAGATAKGGMPVNVHAGSALASGSTAVALASDALDRAGLAPTAGMLNVVGGNGFNSALAQNFYALKSSGFGAGNTGGELIGR